MKATMNTIGIGLACMSVGAIVTAVTMTRAATAQTSSDHTVTQAQFDRWKTELSNAGRWGKEDEMGTANLITRAKRKQAASLVKDGVAVSLARDGEFGHEMVSGPWGNRPMASADRIAVAFHGYEYTHLDGLGHHFLNGRMYNDQPALESVTKDGVQKSAITVLKDGIFTRGILMDIPRLKGVDWLEPGTPIYAEDLEAWEKRSGVKVSSGDIVFIRTGRWDRVAKVGNWNAGQQAAGLDASVLPWLKQRDVAMLGSESALSVVPIPASSPLTNPDDYLPVHNFVLVAFGMNLFDNCDLGPVAQAAATRKRWEFLVTAAPLRIVKGTGSPINPIALF
jgi:kynurenine formamidase